LRLTATSRNFQLALVSCVLSARMKEAVRFDKHCFQTVLVGSHCRGLHMRHTRSITLPALVSSSRFGRLLAAVVLLAMPSCVAAQSSPSGTIATIAGNGISGYSGDGGAATSAEMGPPQDIALDSAGNLYIADGANNVIRKVATSTGTITTVAGNGTAGYSGDGGAATSAELNYPDGVAV